MNEVNNILVIGLTGIGNLVLFSPSAIALKHRFPDAKISLLTYPTGAESLFAVQEYYDYVITLDRSKWMLRSGSKERLKDIIKILKIVQCARNRHFDLSIWPYFPAFDIKKGIIAYMLGAKCRLCHIRSSGILNRLFFNGYEMVVNDLHDVEQNIRLIGLLGIHDVDANPSIVIPEKLNSFVSRFFIEKHVQKDRILVCMHPGGHSMVKPSRRWPWSRYAHLCTLLGKIWGAQILLLGSRTEGPWLRAITRECDTCAVIVDKYSLLEVAAIIRSCNMFIGNDSGLMHISGALGTPTIGIFGPTDPTRTSPRGNKTGIVRLEVECAPCWGTQYGKSCFYQKCLAELTADEVFRQINRFAFVQDFLRAR